MLRLVFIAPCLAFSLSAQAVQIGSAEIGVNDFRISEMGGAPGNPQYGINMDPAVIFNPDRREYLVVWSGRDSEVSEVYGQRLSAAGLLLADRFKISQHSQDSEAFGAFGPAVTYNPDRQEYFVVWYGRDFLLGGNGTEIFGQRLNAEATSLGGNIRLSEMGDETSTFGAFNPELVYNTEDDEYLVVWYGDDNQSGLVDNEFEIFGQRLSGLGDRLAGRFRISAMGAAGDPLAAGFEPDIAFDPVNRWYLVVWHGDPGIGSLENDEFDIYGQLLSSTGQEIGTNDFLISDLGGAGENEFDASWPAVAFHPGEREWLVVWNGDGNQGGQVDGESEIFGQRLTVSGSATGISDFRISAMGGLGDPSYSAFLPEIAFDPISSHYLVSWEGNDGSGEFEAHSTRLRADGSSLERSARLSDMGSTASTSYFAAETALAQDSFDGQFLVIWRGADDLGGHVANETDVFGQRLSFPFFCDGFESGDLGAWSLALDR